MKIAMVSEHASPLAALGGVDAGGQNVHVSALSDALVRLGHQVTVYTRRDAEHLPSRVTLQSGTVVEHVTAGPVGEISKDELLPYMPQFGAYLARRWANDPPDLVHAHFWMSGFAALIGVRLRRIPMVQTYHALGVVKRRHQGARDTSPPGRIRLEKAIGHDASRIISTCADEVFELVRMGVSRRSISVVPSGVDAEEFTPEGPVAPRTAVPRLLVASRLVERKGIDTAVTALSKVPDAELVVAGGPEAAELPGDPEYRRLAAIADHAGVSDRVYFIGRVPRPDMPALIRSADVVVSVPWYEPFGTVPLEAMACGVPVVASAVGGLIDTVVDGATGVLVSPRRPDMLAFVLRQLLGDPVRREGYGIAGADRARARYDWGRIATDTVTVYSQVAPTPVPVTTGVGR